MFLKSLSCKITILDLFVKTGFLDNVHSFEIFYEFILTFLLIHVQWQVDSGINGLDITDRIE